MADDTVLQIFADENNIKSLVTCNGKIETPTENLLHSTDKDKVQPRK